MPGPDGRERRGEGAMRMLAVPADRPFVLVFLNDDGYPNITAPTGQAEGCAMAYMLLELARHYVDRKYGEYTGVHQHMVQPP